MFNRVSFNLDTQLSQFDICGRSCNVVEDHLLKFAEVDKKPSHCQFGGIGQTQEQVYFEINELTEEEATRLFNFFKKFDENTTMKSSLIERDDAEEILRMHRFEVDTAILHGKILPLVIKDLKVTAESAPEQLEVYRSQTAENNPEELACYKIEYAVTDIAEQMKELSSQFSQGHLTVAFHYLSVMITNCEKHVTHGCGKFVSEVNNGIALYNFAQENDNNLKENANAIKLKNSLAAFKNTLTTGVNLFATTRREPVIQILQFGASSELDDSQPADEKDRRCSII